MKKIIVILSLIGVLGFTSCQKHELTATEVLMCEETFNNEMDKINQLLSHDIISLKEYEKRAKEAEQKYKDCIIAAENN